MALPQDNAAVQLCRAHCKLLFGHVLLIPSQCTYARCTGMDMPWDSPKFRVWHVFKLSSACWTIFRRCGSNTKSFSLYSLLLNLLRHIYALVCTTYCLNTWRYTALMVFFLIANQIFRYGTKTAVIAQIYRRDFLLVFGLLIHCKDLTAFDFEFPVHVA